MPRSSTEKRSSAARRARPPTPKKGAEKVAQAVSGGGKSAALIPAPKRLAGAAAKKALRAVLGKSLESGAEVIRRAADRAAVASKSALESGTSRRLPIQVSIDVAVPLRVVWDEWMKAGSLPEGVHRIEDVERDGKSLLGRISGPRGGDWEAEILDEREQESFAWRSIQGSDCAGLVTFHQLSERLTRIELDLDVLPTNPSEALTLAVHLAHRRAEADLRRFKARVEFINPDAYETNGRRNGKGHREGSSSDNARNAKAKS